MFYFCTLPTRSNNILHNIKRIYISAETGSLNRFLLCSNGERGHFDNFMPLDLELEQGDDGYYRIVTAYSKSAKNVEGILLFDGSATPSSDTATDSLMKVDNNNAALSPGAPMRRVIFLQKKYSTNAGRRQGKILNQCER